MLGFLWRASKGHRLAPWRSPYLRWRIETYWGWHADRIAPGDFLRFTWERRADLLRFLIEQKGVTQTEAAIGARIAESTISEVLSGKRKLNRTQIGKLARYFNVEPGSFLQAE